MKRLLLLFVALLPVINQLQAQITSSSACDSIVKLFNSNYNSGEYSRAMPLWREAYKKCPATSKSIYENGAAFFEKLVAAEINAERRIQFVDTVLMIYDRQIRYFNEPGIINGKKGLVLFKYDPARKTEAVQLLGKSIEEVGDHTHVIVLFHYFQGSAQLYNDRQLSVENLAENFYRVSLVYDANRGKTEYDDFSKKTTALFGVLFSCEMIEKIYAGKIKSAPDSVALMQEFIQLCYKRKCTSELYTTTAEKLYRKGPTPLTCKCLAQIYTSKGQPEKAMGFFNDATEMESDPVKKSVLLMDAAEFQQQELKSFPQARIIAMRAATFNPGWGRPWMFIGDLYFDSVKECKDSLYGKPVFWAATDKYLKAKTIDPTMTDLANQKTAKCMEMFPE